MGKESKEGKQMKKREMVCSVCMEIRSGAHLNCSHKFCMRCISRWVKVLS